MRIGENILIAEAHDAHTQLEEDAVSRSVVVAACVVDTAVHFDGEFEPWAVEVDDEAANDVLSAESPPRHAAAPQHLPELSFRVRRVRAIASRQPDLRRMRSERPTHGDSSPSHDPLSASRRPELLPFRRSPRRGERAPGDSQRLASA